MIDFFRNSLEQLSIGGRLRTLKPLKGRDGCRIVHKGRIMLNLTSNDYLGLAGDKKIHQKFYAGMTESTLIDNFALGAASSRLLSGDSFVAHQLEDSLRTAYGKEASLLYNSGYHANIGILPALFGKNDLILSDKLNHASIMDGMRLCSAHHKRYRHCDYEHLAALLTQYRNGFQRVVIVSESVFSMDGDVADIAQLVALKKQFDCLLYLDEAHAVGIFGDSGLGMAEEQGQLPEVDLLVGTFGKAFASVGAYLLCSDTIRDYLINHSRSLIFTTALPPVVISWNNFIFREVAGFADKRDNLRNLAAMLRHDLRDKGIETGGSTHIVPVMLGDDKLATSLSEAMQEKGYLIFPVRPPTVPEGTSRFRLSLTADMQSADLAFLVSDLASLLHRFHNEI